MYPLKTDTGVTADLDSSGWGTPPGGLLYELLSCCEIAARLLGGGDPVDVWTMPTGWLAFYWPLARL